MGRGDSTGVEAPFDFSDISRAGISDISLMSEYEEWVLGVTDSLNGTMIHGDWAAAERLLDKAKFRCAMLDGKAGGDTQEFAHQLLWRAYKHGGAETINQFYQRFLIPAGLEPGCSWLLGSDKTGVIHLYDSADVAPLGNTCTDRTKPVQRPLPRGSAHTGEICDLCEAGAEDLDDDALNQIRDEGPHYAVTDSRTKAGDSAAAIAALAAYMNAHRESESPGFAERACKEMHEQLLSMTARATAKRFVEGGASEAELTRKLFLCNGSDESLLSDLQQIALSKGSINAFQSLATSSKFVASAILTANREGQENDLDFARGRFLGCFFAHSQHNPEQKALALARLEDEKSVLAAGIRQTLRA